MARLVLRGGIKGIIIDYWQLISGVQKGQTKEEHLSNVAQWIAGFCRRHGVWSIVLSQLNKEDNAFGSAGLNRACDQFYKLYRSDIEKLPEPGLAGSRAQPLHSRRRNRLRDASIPEASHLVRPRTSATSTSCRSTRRPAR